jgi:hypothetical protein
MSQQTKRNLPKLQRPGRPNRATLSKSIWSSPDRWRLKHAACLESGICAAGIIQPDEIASGNAEVDKALAQARVWISTSGFPKVETSNCSDSTRAASSAASKRTWRIRTLQAERKASLEQALEEADLLCKTRRKQREETEPAQFVTSLTRFDFQPPTSPVSSCAAATCAKPESGSRTSANCQKIAA